MADSLSVEFRVQRPSAAFYRNRIGVVEPMFGILIGATRP